MSKEYKDRIAVPLKPDMKKTIKSKAHKLEMTVAEYIRHLVVLDNK